MTEQLLNFCAKTPTEIGLWLTAQGENKIEGTIDAPSNKTSPGNSWGHPAHTPGLGQFAEKFQEEGVDGDLLLSLTPDELRDDLGLSNIQTKKVLKNVEFSRDLGASAGTNKEETEAARRRVDELVAERDASAAEAEELRSKLRERDEEVRTLRDEMAKREEEVASLREEVEGMKSAAVVVEAEPEPAKEEKKAPPPPVQAAPAPQPQPQHANRRRGPGKLALDDKCASQVSNGECR